MNNSTNMSNIVSTIELLESAIASLRSMIDVSAAAVAKPKIKRASKAAADPNAEPKPKREINPKIAEMNVERKAIYAEMVAAWDLANPAYAALSKDELKTAVAEGRVAKRPTYPDALKEHSRRLTERDPNHVTVKSKASKPSAPVVAPAPAADTATVSSTESKTKRGPKPGFKLTEEQKKQRRDNRNKNKADKQLPPLPTSPSSD